MHSYELITNLYSDKKVLCYRAEVDCTVLSGIATTDCVAYNVIGSWKFPC